MNLPARASSTMRNNGEGTKVRRGLKHAARGVINFERITWRQQAVLDRGKDETSST
jgi:hypothetical protein